MPPKTLSTANGLVLLLVGCQIIGAESLGDALRAANVPLEGFADADLRQSITSYAASKGDPFLLAYYVDDGSRFLRPPLHVVRIERSTGDINRMDFPNIGALYENGDRIDCLGSALRVGEHVNTIFIQIHLNPSAGCVIFLSSALSYRAALSGLLVGLMGPDIAIVRKNEIHFTSVSPLHIAVYDLVRSRSADVFPPEGDLVRQQYSRLIQPHISAKWCMEKNAQCDPTNFDTEIAGQPAVNEVARVFGFEAGFDAAGFGEDAEKNVAPRKVAYIFRERGETWEYREFDPSQIQSRFGASDVGDLVTRKPGAAFEDGVVR